MVSNDIASYEKVLSIWRKRRVGIDQVRELKNLQQAKRGRNLLYTIYKQQLLLSLSIFLKYYFQALLIFSYIS